MQRGKNIHRKTNRIFNNCIGLSNTTSQCAADIAKLKIKNVGIDAMTVLVTDTLKERIKASNQLATNSIEITSTTPDNPSEAYKLVVAKIKTIKLVSLNIFSS